jgi:ABC-2 type transport system permease protein
MSQHEIRPIPSIRRIAAKEITLFFASPIAYLFLASFAGVGLFVFFWGEAFFARNIADVRPLFEWMPILLIFLASTLTMRMWSEERRSGTLEYVLTQPAPLWHFVLGKFLACLALLAVALLITLPLPITVSVIGELDWGPVWAGYLATFLLGAAYLSVGLFVSARSDNQIVSLITATALCGFFYLLGSATLTDLFGTRVGEWLRLLGTGSRFESITRGVIDLRDLYYYLSIIATFLVLNAFVLERERWASGRGTPHHNRWRTLCALLIANALAGNLWLGQVSSLRLDATEGQQYSISQATRNYLSQLREPLLLRGYFSAKTHPLLSPLVPQLRDLLREYEVAGDGKVRVEIVDPATDPEMESEANQKYGIRPVPFQVEDRYQSAIVSSYFNVLVQYGDEYQVLGFRDLIEIKALSEAEFDVHLRNPEHDLTRAVRKVLNSYQAGGNLFDTVTGELDFTAYVSGDEQLPAPLREFRGTVEKVAGELAAQSGGRLRVAFVDPDADGGEVGRKIGEEFGFQPMTTSLFSDERFYFYLTLAGADTLVQIPLEDTTESSFRRNLEAGIKRFSSGFTKTVAMVTPPQEPMYAQYGIAGAQFNLLEEFLAKELNVQPEDLSDGAVSGEADLLLLLAPENLDERQLFAVDQFLMQGGTVIVASSPFRANYSGNGISLQRNQSGLSDWLAHNGLKLGEELVLDPQNAAFPLPVTRDVGGFQLQELRMLDYPYFIDVRADGMNRDNPILTDLPQMTFAWASPISVDEEKSGQRVVTELLHSSAGSWLSADTDIQPRFDARGQSGYRPEGETGARLLGVISTGAFDSYFAGKASPLLAAKPEGKEGEAGSDAAGETDGEEAPDPTYSGVIERAPDSARIILFSSNDFLQDQVVNLASAASGSTYLNNQQMLANTVDWALEDQGLLAIRARGHFNRTLPPLEHGAQQFWEYLNYALVALALALVAFFQRRRQQRRQQGLVQLVLDETRGGA